LTEVILYSTLLIYKPLKFKIMKTLSQQSRVFFLSLSFFLFNYAIAQQTCKGALEFDATNTAVELPLNNQYYTSANGGYTWECWFKLNKKLGLQVRPLISAVDGVMFEDNYFGFGWQGGFFNTSNDSLVFRVEGPGSMSPANPNCAWAPLGGFIVGQWYHAAGVVNYTAGKKFLYVNGTLVSSAPATVPGNPRVIQTNLSSCTACGPMQTLDGRMDEVRIWNRPLTATEIAANYNQCLAGNEPNLVVYYRCNQLGALNVLDATVNANNGTFLTPPLPGWVTDNAPLSGTGCDRACACLGSLNFDNLNTAVQLPLTNQYYAGANNGYTWETWFKLNQPFNNNDRPLISAVDWTLFEDNYFGFGWHGGFFNTSYDSLVFRVEGPSSVAPTDPSCAWAPLGGFVVGQWYHAAGVADYVTGKKYLYVNGVLVSLKPLTVLPNPRVIQTNLSSCDGCTAVNSNQSNMDEVRIWGRPLSATEIATNYNKCRSGTEPNLLVYYRCNQVGASNVIDGSPNGFTGTFLSAIGWSNINAPVSSAFCRKDCNVKGTSDPKGRTAGIENQTNQEAGLKLYPNPSSGTIKVSSQQPGVLTVYTITGKVLSEIQVLEREKEVKLESYKAGIYLYIFTSESSRVSGKLIIE
jgi:hypothetical protein